MRTPTEGGSQDEANCMYLVLRAGRICLWWFIAEYMIHVMYMHSIQANETYLQILPPWALGTCEHLPPMGGFPEIEKVIVLHFEDNSSPDDYKPN